MTAIIIIAVIAVVIVVLALILFGMYNGLIRSRNRVKEAWSGREIGKTKERYEYHDGKYELSQDDTKRGVIYGTADRLAEKFVEGANQGRFGKELLTLHAPSAWEQAPHGRESGGLTSSAR